MIGCSRAAVYSYIKSSKFSTAQKINGSWYVNSDEVRRAIDTRMIRSKKRKNKRLNGENQHEHTRTPDERSTQVSNPALSMEVSLQFKYPREKFELIRIALGLRKVTPADFFVETMNSFYNDVVQKLTNVLGNFESDGDIKP